MSKEKILVRNLYKVFGPQPEKAIDLLRQGWSKERILAERGAVIGVNDVSFSINEGEIFVLMGLSGSGKSTLIRLINRLIEPTAGDVLIDGENVAKMSREKLIGLRRRDMSMVFQSFALLPSRTVLENAAFGLEIAGDGRKQRERRAMKVLEQVGLAGFADKYPHELSGGMQQRVGLARALAVDPLLMIMDEAFSALDPLKRREMQDVLLDLQKKERRTIIFVSHDIEEAMRIGNRIGVMRNGQLIQVGSAQELIENPADDYVRNFFSTVDTSRYLTAGQIKADNVPLFIHNGQAPDAGAVRRALLSQGRHHAFVIDEQRVFRGSISLGKLTLLAEQGGHPRLEQSLLEALDPVPEDQPLETVIERLALSNGPIPVRDQAGRYAGAIDHSQLLEQLRGAAAHG